MGQFRPEEYRFDNGSVRIAVVAARWNAEITDSLLAGAVRTLARQGIEDTALSLIHI